MSGISDKLAEQATKKEEAMLVYKYFGYLKNIQGVDRALELTNKTFRTSRGFATAHLYTPDQLVFFAKQLFLDNRIKKAEIMCEDAQNEAGEWGGKNPFIRTWIQK